MSANPTDPGRAGAASQESLAASPTGSSVALALSQLGPEAIAALDFLRSLDEGTIGRDELEGYATGPVRVLVAAVLRIRELASVETSVARRHKLIVAATPDPQAILVALALRAERISSLSEPDEALGRETLEMHAPLAHRLGLTVLKGELEEAAFRNVDPLGHARTAEAVHRVPGSGHVDVGRLSARLAGVLSRADVVDVEVTGRRKSLYSLHRKLTSGRALDEVMDLVGLRVVCATVDQCYLALAEIHRVWPNVRGRFKDFIAVPSANGYRSVHTTVLIDTRPVEVQIRTEEMHVQAEWGVAAHWLYKHGAEATNMSSGMQPPAAPTDPIEALDRLRSELVGEEVFAITPVGRLLQLPAGATPVDFAYAIHTEVGHRCTLAKVDGKLHRLNAPLPTVSTVEIVTSDRAGPNREWLMSVKTGRAATKIRAWF